MTYCKLAKSQRQLTTEEPLNPFNPLRSSALLDKLANYTQRNTLSHCVSWSKISVITSHPYPLSVEIIRCLDHINWKQQNLVSPLSTRRSDSASLATEERHSPKPVFDPLRGRHTGTEEQIQALITQIYVSESCLSVLQSQCKFHLKSKIPSCLSHRRRPSFSSFTPGSQSLLPPAIKQQRWAR